MSLVIAPIIPPPAPLQQLIHGPIDPVPVPPDRGIDVVYGTAVVADSGRIADLRTVRALGWTTGTTLEIHPSQHGLLLIAPATDTTTAPVTLGKNGYLRIPYRLRRRVNLFIGDIVLVAAYPEHRRMAVHPPSALNALLEPTRTELLRGETR